MQISSILLLLSLVKCASGSDWCYAGCEHTPCNWADMPGSSCGGKRQSPVDIITNHVETDNNLGKFTLVNFSSKHTMKSIVNTGHTVKVKLAEGDVEVSGGGLHGTYSTIQFHFHWGGSEHHPGSEHMIDGKRYPMEMHIVSLKKGLSVSEAVEDPMGIAALGFFLNAIEDGDSTGLWSMLESTLDKLKDTEVNITEAFSIDQLIKDVDLTKFYRYMGSLTTPNCSEAVVWTVFHEPINISKKLIEKFRTQAGYSHAFRPIQKLNGRRVYASPATPLPSKPKWCYEDHCDNSPSHWHLLPYSHCHGQRQSPINIEKEHAVVNEHLGTFTFMKFSDKHAIKSIVNTGHTVKCNLMEGLVEVSGGGLGHVYSTLQFHFHWGSAGESRSEHAGTEHAGTEHAGTEHAGSEHAVDSKRYPMEMHIVNKRKDLNLTEAVKTPNGLAALAFFIEVADSSKSSEGSDHHETNSSTNHTSNKEAWKKLTSYLAAIQNISSEVNITEQISIDDLLGNVDRTAYYRYNGSLTTPLCHEAVVWTVFKEPIKVDKELIMMFPKQTGYHNVFRPAQRLHNRTILTTASASGASGSITLLLMSCLYALFI